MRQISSEVRICARVAAAFNIALIISAAAVSNMESGCCYDSHCAAFYGTMIDNAGFIHINGFIMYISKQKNY